MGEKIVVGPINRGLRNDVTPFNIDNDSFPQLINAYQWRSRVKRKRGTSLLNRLTRYFDSTLSSYNLTVPIAPITLNASGEGNLLTGFMNLTAAALAPDASLVSRSISITASSTNTYSDANGDAVILQETGPGYVTAITNITLPTSTSAELTLAGHNFVAGQTVYVSGVGGMTQINGSYYVISSTTANTIIITTPVNTAWSAYTAGGTAKRVSGSVNYSTGLVTILAEANNTITATFRYYPNLPVMGIEEFIVPTKAYPGTIGFDTVYSYNINNNAPYGVYDVSFYKNPTTGTYTGYTQKADVTPTTWNGDDYQQFWTVNYQGALWATNGITVPFTITNVGMQYKFVTEVTMIVVGPPATARLTIANHGLVVGDFLFLNEFPSAVVTGINFQTVYVIAVPDANHVDVEFQNGTLGGAGGATATGIAQYLTNRSDTTKDSLRWYDGDPTDGNVTTPTLNGRKGWVNFAPPLSQFDYSIADLPADQYYLVGARAILPFKDRLLFFGPVVQTSSANSQKYLKDTVIYSQNGTPYYTASFTNSPATSDTPTNPSVVFNPILVPDNQTASPAAFMEDTAGFGGFIEAGVSEPIVTVSTNQDVVLVGFQNFQSKLVYSGNDIVPFNFFIINSEFGSSSTFSSINMDRGTLTVGARGIITTSQVSSSRIDLEIPDQIFQINLQTNGAERVCSQRDFINEWCYFTYPDNEQKWAFPNQTLQYNYRDNSWGLFNECYTTYGLYRKVDGLTWATVGDRFPTWAEWNEPWNSGSSTLLTPQVLAGNQQGFLLLRDEGTGEGNSLQISNISGNTVTSPNHCLNDGDYIIISGALGAAGAIVNGNIYSVNIPSPLTPDTFTLNPVVSVTPGTYLGGGVIKRMYIPFIQSKQFPTAWGMSRKTRLGPQQYLFTTTNLGQVTLLIYLSQDADSAYNIGAILPSPGPFNSGLIYSTVVYTCTESVNLGLSSVAGSSNTNLQMISNINSAGTNASSPQAQIWHRENTSLIGDTVQIGITLNDAQMRDTSFNSQFAEIELHGFILDASPSQVLA